MRKRDLKKIGIIEDKLQSIEKLVKENQVLDIEEKDNLIFSLKYIIHIILKYDNGIL